VPSKIGIAGFNDLEMMEVAFPSITSVRTPRYDIGRMAISMARAAIAGERPEQHVVDTGFELMIRESTAR
jgi:LacI family gluconate utilization system Gnt-I transcriptional repressor